MIDKVFVGKRENVGSPTLPTPAANDKAIVKAYVDRLEISTFPVSEIMREHADVSDDGSQRHTRKVDMLFYNRVNSNGAVFSSIIYLGDVLPSDSSKTIVFSPKILYYNGTTEAAMDLQRETNFHYFNYIRDIGGVQPCFIGYKTEEFNIDGMPSLVVSGNTPTLDGWYTLVSASVLVEPLDDLPRVKAGAFVQFDDIVYMALVDSPDRDNPEHWHRYDVFDNRFNIAFYVDQKFSDASFDWYPPFVREDFFILPRYDEVYGKTVEDYVFDTQLNNLHMSLKSKYRMISHYAKVEDYKRAQFYLQSENLTIITENWI